jgi:hypothetical protein
LSKSQIELKGSGFMIKIYSSSSGHFKDWVMTISTLKELLCLSSSSSTANVPFSSRMIVTCLPWQKFRRHLFYMIMPYPLIFLISSTIRSDRNYFPTSVLLASSLGEIANRGGRNLASDASVFPLVPTFHYHTVGLPSQ